MKQLKSITADLAELQATPQPTGVVNWQLEYNKLRDKVMTMQRRMDMLEHPPRTDAELERNMMLIRAFATSMSLSEGAVTCANLYNKQFFVTEQDSKFVKALCSYLVERYEMNSALIEDTFSLWQSLAA